jgi:hypothetical protein
VTEVKSGPGFQKATNSALMAVMRRNAALAEDYARRHGVPRWYADAQALIADPDVEPAFRLGPYGLLASPVVPTTNPEGQTGLLCTNPN